MSQSNQLPPNEAAIFQALPLQIDEPFNATSLLLSLTPWNTIGISGIRGGFIRDQSGDSTVIINGEWPKPVAQKMSKRDKEWLHLYRYMADFLTATARRPYVALEAGNDPPDFVDANGLTRIGIECTQLVSQHRRHINDLFERVRRGIENEPRERFAHLHGLMVYMWWDQEAGQIAKPPKRTDASAIPQIVDALTAYRFDPERITLPSVELPDRAPGLNVASTPGRCHFYAIPVANSASVTAFLERTGFEMGLAYTTVHRKSEVVLEMTRLVNDHDCLGVNDLLVTIGGPNEEGFVFPTEDVFASLALENWPGIEPPRFISTVKVHFWSNGSIIELFPEYRLIGTGTGQHLVEGLKATEQS